MKFNVEWQKLWKKLTKTLFILILIPVIFMLIIRYFQSGMSIEITFEHITVYQLPFFFICIFLGSLFFAFLVSILIKYAAVEIDNGYLEGRNYWFIKKRIPIKSISKLYLFRDNGIEAVVADAGQYGKVYISTHTEKLDELIKYLEDNSELMTGS
ncbi:MAG: hypothetical protein ACPGUW_12240 [Pseudoalteromonas shioyasakiensis]